MTIGEVMRELILAGSGFAMGALLVLGIRSVRAAYRDSNRRDTVGHIALATARFGSVVILALIAELIYHSLEIPPTWRAVVYLVATVAVSVGYFIALLTHTVSE